MCTSQPLQKLTMVLVVKLLNSLFVWFQNAWDHKINQTTVFVGVVGGGNEYPAHSPPSIPQLRCPWARHRTPNCRSINDCPLLHVCVCSRYGLNGEHKIQVCITILGCMSLSLFIFNKILLRAPIWPVTALIKRSPWSAFGEILS